MREIRRALCIWLKHLVPSNCTHRSMTLKGELRRAFTWGPPGPRDSKIRSYLEGEMSALTELSQF